MSVFEDIRTGPEDAVKYERGGPKARTVTLEILPIEHFDPIEIKEIRKSTGLTQKSFALFMGVSVKTVEAWESGRNHPEGAACRLLSLTRNDPAFPRNTGIVSF